MCVAIIPARRGSKRLPGKNIRDFMGKPAIAHAISAAVRSELFDRVIVSTDCAETAGIGVAFGAEVPFRRPAALSNDECGTLPVLQHALGFLQAQGDRPEFACCVYPTAVLLTPHHLRESFTQLVAAPTCNYCFSVCAYEHPIQRALRIDESGSVAVVNPEHSNTRTQDLPVRYYDAGQFYWGAAAAMQTGQPIFSSAALPYILGKNEFVDVNELEDWERAEALAKVLAQSSARADSRRAEEPQPLALMG